MGEGAYGFRLIFEDTEESQRDLIELSEALPDVTVSWRHATTIADSEEVSDSRVSVGARGANTILVEREPASIRFFLPQPPAPGALVHPLLTIGVSILARWRGDVTLHAGAFQTDGGGWGVMGAREAGKSALLAALAVRGIPILSDDLLTTDSGRIWAGPDCVDLRPDSASRFPGAHYLGIVGSRPRYRLSTPPSKDRAPFRGFFVLDWHDRSTVEVEPMSARDRLAWLYRQEYIGLMGPTAPEAYVPLLALPAWYLRRPREWSETDAMVNRVLELANGT
jgi:hypothetical protein